MFIICFSSLWKCYTVVIIDSLHTHTGLTLTNEPVWFSEVLLLTVTHIKHSFQIGCNDKSLSPKEP